MGIPSYYKKLIHTVPGLVSNHSHEVSWLFMDFNCLIYHCIPAIDPLQFTEEALITEVVRYTKEVVKEVAPQKGVYIAIDGVVPMAKMRQQRLRRFKSVWEKTHLQQNDGTSVSWDKNAITPGTAFMKALAYALQQVCDEKGWILSSAEQPQEAEHKLTAEWRTGNYSGLDIAVYGMDADLIVLSLLGQIQNQLGAIWLFREQEDRFEWFSIDILKSWLLQGRDSSFILTYCFAMSILGNDFLPSSLGLKMRDGGHDELLRCLMNPLIDNTYQILEENLYMLFHQLAAFEPHRVAKYIHTKQRMANQNGEKGLGENNWPLSCIEEDLIGPTWNVAYWKLIDGAPVDVCQEYLKGIRWIWSYYTGRPICFNWFYPYVLPPLWSSLVQTGLVQTAQVQTAQVQTAQVQTAQVQTSHVQTAQGNGQSCMILQSDMPQQMRAEDILPVELLCLVLPLESWSLIPDCHEKRFPMLAPQFFPSSFGFESIGKRFWWETTPHIPIPTILELKKLIHSYYH